MRIWLDDLRPAPAGYIHCYSVNQAINMIKVARCNKDEVELLDLDHDLGDYAQAGGDGIKLLDWCIEHDFYPVIHLHTANPVGKANMQRTIDRYWR